LLLRFVSVRGFFAGAFLEGFLAGGFLAWGFLGFLGIAIYLNEVKIMLDLTGGAIDKHEFVFSVEYEPHKVLISFFGELHELLENLMEFQFVPWLVRYQMAYGLPELQRNRNIRLH